MLCTSRLTQMTPFGLLIMILGLCEAKIWEVPLPEHIQDCYNKVRTSDIKTYIGSTFSWMCESNLKYSQNGKPGQLDAQKISYYKHLYEQAIPYLPNSTTGVNGARNKRQARRARCTRREYRVLSDEERRRFHTAVNTLKLDTTVEPNKYDAIALLHEAAVNSAHSGAGFTGWHRLYLLMFETALREVDPSVCLPYWDSSLDSDLQDPTRSSVWTRAFFGTPNGPVVDGPFANWTTPKGAQLIRNVGADGELFTTTGIEDILSRRRYEDITSSPTVEPRYDLEFYHGGVHMFCGGTMSQLDTAAFDPIFFLVHAFVDYIWELFRTNLRVSGVDPEKYPDIVAPDSLHHSSASTGFGNLLQSDAYRDALTQTFEYEPVPVCSSRTPQCGSRHLTCLERTGRCVPYNAGTVQVVLPDPVPTEHPPSPVNSSIPSESACLRPEKPYSQAVQNDYCCDATCDTNKWVMIPVKIISVRPPKFDTYQSYPVHNGLVDRHDDIYSPRAYVQTNRFITQLQTNPKTYKRCTGDESVGQVFISSRGINYHGYYKEAAIVDQRLAVSISMGFVSVKKPEHGVSTAIIRAHDSCGRVCHAACKDPVTKQYKDCKGAIAVSSELPLMYGATYDEAVMTVFDYEFNSALPQFKNGNIFITFHCDYRDNFPYTDYGHVPEPQPTIPPPETTPAAVVPSPSNVECMVTPQCVLDVPCASAERQCRLSNEKYVCRGSCRFYGVCIYGRYFLRACPEGHYFDTTIALCLPGSCQNTQEQMTNNQNNSDNTRKDHILKINTGIRSMRTYTSNLLTNILKSLGH